MRLLLGHHLIGFIQAASIFFGLFGTFDRSTGLTLCPQSRAADQFSLSQVAGGVYVHFGETSLMTAENAGDLEDLARALGA